MGNRREAKIELGVGVRAAMASRMDFELGEVGIWLGGLLSLSLGGAFKASLLLVSNADYFGNRLILWR